MRGGFSKSMCFLCASHKVGIRPQGRGFWNLFHCVNSSKKGLQNRHSYAIILVVPSQILGCRQAVRHQTLTLAFVGSNPAIPAKSDPLAQLAEQLPFKQWVRGSNPRRVTKTLKALGLSGFLYFLVPSPDPLPKPQFLRKAVGLIYGKKAIANGSKKLEN